MVGWRGTRSDWGERGWTGGSEWRLDEVASKISQVSLWFADMSFDVNVVHPICFNLDKVNFGLDKLFSSSR